MKGSPGSLVPKVQRECLVQTGSLGSLGKKETLGEREPQASLVAKVTRGKVACQDLWQPRDFRDHLGAMVFQ